MNDPLIVHGGVFDDFGNTMNVDVKETIPVDAGVYRFGFPCPDGIGVQDEGVYRMDIPSGRERWSPHVACPECAGLQIQRTGWSEPTGVEYVIARCLDCGWRGDVENLIEGESD
jgi:predicted RNA-binding Zn-ribbon protein involved in translation (DUF1610 family)